MTADEAEVRRVIGAIRSRGVSIETVGGQVRVPRRHLSAHEVETLRLNADTVHRVLSAAEPEQQEQEQATAAGGSTPVPLPAPPAAASRPVAAPAAESRDTGHAGPV